MEDDTPFMTPKYRYLLDYKNLAICVQLIKDVNFEEHYDCSSS